MIHVRSIAVVATATTVAITGGVFVLAMMILVFLSGFFGGGGGMIMPLGGAVALIIAPLLYGVIAWLATALFCVVYNWAATFTGGIGFRVERDDPPTSARNQDPPTT
ncbi:hypothetical protein BH23CHL9_BH23CHL9_02460 [soil metagenome]